MIRSRIPTLHFFWKTSTIFKIAVIVHTGTVFEIHSRCTHLMYSGPHHQIRSFKQSGIAHHYYALHSHGCHQHSLEIRWMTRYSGFTHRDLLSNPLYTEPNERRRVHTVGPRRNFVRHSKLTAKSTQQPELRFPHHWRFTDHLVAHAGRSEVGTTDLEADICERPRDSYVLNCLPNVSQLQRSTPSILRASCPLPMAHTLSMLGVKENSLNSLTAWRTRSLQRGNLQVTQISRSVSRCSEGLTV